VEQEQRGVKVEAATVTPSLSREESVVLNQEQREQLVKHYRRVQFDAIMELQRRLNPEIAVQKSQAAQQTSTVGNEEVGVDLRVVGVWSVKSAIYSRVRCIAAEVERWMRLGGVVAALC